MTIYITAQDWPYTDAAGPVVVLDSAKEALRAAGYVHRDQQLRDQLATTPAPVVPSMEET